MENTVEGATPAESGTVVFLKSDAESDSANDIWDDTALIKAYDRAIQQSHQANSDLRPPKSKKKNKGKKKAEKPQKQWKWSVGNQCRAVYSEDGFIYDAVITEMLSDGKCVVQYTEYGNEEEQYLRDLLRPRRRPLPPSDREGSVRSHSPARSTSCSECSTNHNAKPAHPRPHHHGNYTKHPGMPSFVPPPPPSIPGMAACDTDEAFHSMLISWYMSGFHTGYYQGLKDGRSESAGAHSTLDREEH